MGKKARNKFPTFAPANKRTHTAKVDLDTYIEKWMAFREDALRKGELSVKTWKDFNKEHGDFIDENGLKYKPSNINRPGKISTTIDFNQNLRKWRGEILTYMFGGTPIDSASFGKQWMTEEYDKYGYPVEGGDFEAHHWYGNAEAAPWVDDIIDDWFEGGDLRQRSRSMIEAGRAYFEDSPYYLGDVKENYRLYTGPQHTGRDSKKIAGMFPELSVHGRQGPSFDFGTDVTGSMGRSPFIGTQNIPSYTLHEDVDLDKSDFLERPKGVRGQDTVDYIRSRPWSKEETLRFVEDEVVGGKGRKKKLKNPVPNEDIVSRWSSFEDHIKYSGGIRDDLEVEILNNPKLKTRRQLGLEIDLGGLETKFNKFGGKLGKADALTNFGVGMATGNYLQALGGGAGLALQSEKNQAKIAKQFTKRLGKSGLKFIPGVDVALSGMEAYGYLREGKFDQMGIALASGAIGWVPVVGDAAAAALDLTNTGLDVYRMDLNNKGDADLDSDKPAKSRSVLDVDVDLDTPNFSSRYLRGLKF